MIIKYYFKKIKKKEVELYEYQKDKENGNDWIIQRDQVSISSASTIPRFYPILRIALNEVAATTI